MKKEYINLPYKKGKKKKFLVKAQKIGTDLIIDIASNVLVMRTVLQKKSFENYIPDDFLFSVSKYRTVTFNKGFNSKNISGIFDWYFRKEHFQIEDADKTLIQEFCNYNGDFIDVIACYERTITNERTDKAREKRYKALAELSKSIPEKIPEGFINFGEKIVSHSLVYILPFKGRKQTTGICSVCEKSFTINKNDTIKRCPVCNAKVEITKKTKHYTHKEDVIFVQMTKENLLERHFGFWEEVQFDPKDASVLVRKNNYEKGLYLYNFESKQTKKLFKKFDYWTRKTFWDDKNIFGMNNIRFMSGPTYGLNKILKLEQFKYSGIEYLDGDIDPFNYLSRYLQMPCLEMLAKIGLTNLAKSISIEDMADSYKKPWELLKVNKEEFNRMRLMNATVSELKWFQYENAAKIRIDDEDIKFFAGKYITPQSLDFIYPTMSYKKIRNYIETQETHQPNARYDYGYYLVVDKWRDYIDMAKNLKKDVSLELVYKPKNVFLAHDELVSIQIANEREAEILLKFPTVNEIIRSLSKYSFEDENYAIVVPEGIKDIVREGRILGHCLDRTDIYFDRISRHESFIFFLRKKTDVDMPFYSLEVEPDGTTRQKRTYGDRQDKDYQECVDFIKKWQRHLKKVLTDEDLDFAKTSAKLREENFKDLRERNEKVWHGLLAGQLLADVLEADLMLA